MVRNASNPTLNGSDVVYVMEILLKRHYSKVANNIAGLNHNIAGGDKASNMRKQTQQKPQNKNIEPQDDIGFVFVDTQKRVIARWVKKA